MINAFSFLTGSSNSFSFTELPTPPADIGTPTVLDPAVVGSSVTPAELNYPTQRMGLAINPYANRLQSAGLVASEAEPIIFKSQSDATYSVVGGATISTSVFTQTTATISDWVEYHHMIGLGRTNASVTGGRWIGKAGGSNIKYQDIIFKDVTIGIHINGNGNAGTYNNVVIRFVRVIGRNTNNEAFYLGETTTTTGVYGVMANLLVEHCFGTDKGWDGFQMNSVQNATVRNVTIFDVAKAAASGQNSALQAQNIGDGAIIENCLFWGAVKAFQVAARDITFTKCVFYSDEAGIYQDVELDAGYEFPLSTAGGTITFDRCEFYSSGARTNGVLMRENKANIVFLNCKKGSNITNLVSDDRTDKVTYSLTETGTTEGTAVTPTFNNLDYTDPDHALVNEVYYRNNGIGYRC
jgi:hypothetical protein